MIYAVQKLKTGLPLRVSACLKLSITHNFIPIHPPLPTFKILSKAAAKIVILT
jgi:hypothetical protein